MLFHLEIAHTAPLLIKDGTPKQKVVSHAPTIKSSTQPQESVNVLPTFLTSTMPVCVSHAIQPPSTKPQRPALCVHLEAPGIPPPNLVSKNALML